MSPRMGRRALAGAALALGALRPHPAPAQGRPVRLVVPYSAGSGPDVFARQLGQGLSTRLGQTVVIDNRAGATTMLGTENVAASPADGTVLLLGTSTTFAANPHLFRRLNYGVAQFRPITMLIRTRLALYASPASGLRDLPGVIARAKASPEPLPFGITGRGNSTHLTGAALMLASGITLQDVSYRSVASMQQGLMRDDIPLAIDGIPAYLPVVAEGRIRVVAVTGEGRVGALPETPTFAEAGVQDLGRQHWYGLFAPAGLPAATLERLHAATIATMDDAPLWRSLVQEGATIETQSPDAFAALIARETEAWGAIIRRVGLTLDGG